MVLLEHDIGGKLRALRKTRQLTLQGLAKKLKMTASYISRLERNLCYPALETLYELAAFFGLDISFFFRKDQITDEKSRVLKGRDRAAGSLFEGRVQSRPYANIKYRDPSFEAFSAVSRPGVTVKLPRQKGQACVLVLRGMIEFVLSSETYALRPGDSVYFSTREEHSYTVLGKRPAELAVFVYPARFHK